MLKIMLVVIAMQRAVSALGIKRHLQLPLYHYCPSKLQYANIRFLYSLTIVYGMSKMYALCRRTTFCRDFTDRYVTLVENGDCWSKRLRQVSDVS